MSPWNISWPRLQGQLLYSFNVQRELAHNPILFYRTVIGLLL